MFQALEIRFLFGFLFSFTLSLTFGSTLPYGPVGVNSIGPVAVK